MPSLCMRGPYPLTAAKVDQTISGRFPGNFAVGYLKESGAFVVRYVGRSDSDLNQAIKDYPADDSTKFKWSYAEGAKEAFDRQCKAYHDFGGRARLDNETHPQPPDNTGWKCAFCDELG